MPTKPDSRVEIFLDSSNFYNGLVAQFENGRYDIRKLVKRIVGNRSLVCFNLYVGTVDPRLQEETALKQQQFLSRVENYPFPVQVYTRPLKYYGRGPGLRPQEKGIDTKIVQDMIVGAFDERYDVAVLLSGDQDFIEVVRLLHGRFDVELETYYPASRRHLYEITKECFSVAEVIGQSFFDDIAK